MCSVILLTMPSVTVAVTGRDHKVRAVLRDELGFAPAFGIFLCASWFCNYRVGQDNLGSLVVRTDELVSSSPSSPQERTAAGAALSGLPSLSVGTVSVLCVLRPDVLVPVRMK